VGLLTKPAGAAYQISINTLRVPDPKVRLAMAYALDRQGMLDGVFLGQGVVQECCFLNDWAIPDGQTPYPYDPERARELLAEAGWDSSQELSIIFPQDYRQSDTLVPIIQQQLAEVGITTVIEPQESTAFRQKLIEEKDWDIFFNQGANMLPDPGSFTVWECPTGGFAQSGWIYCDDTMANLYEAGRTTVDQAERTEIYQQIQTIFYEQVPTVNLFVPYTVFVMSSPDLVEGIEATPFYSQITWNIHEWSINR
jgi:peptide/nickel transport system substrate-binding protein